MLRGERDDEVKAAELIGEVKAAEVHILEDKEKRAMNLTNADVHAELRHSQFCLEPQGDTPSRSQIFEGLLSGCIPVFFSSCVRPDLVYERMYEPFLPKHERTTFGAGPWAVVLDARRVLTNATYVMDELAGLARNTSQIDEMRRTIIGIMPRLQYRDVPATDEQPMDGSDAQDRDAMARKLEGASRYAPDALDVLASIMQDRGITGSATMRARAASVSARR